MKTQRLLSAVLALLFLFPACGKETDAPPYSEPSEQPKHGRNDRPRRSR